MSDPTDRHRQTDTDRRDDPQRLAAASADLPRPWLIGVDVDGTLAPIVPRPEMSELAPGALDVLEQLVRSVGVMVAVVSGRPLADLRDRFGLPPSIMLLGSHGAEIGSAVDERTDAEQQLIDRTIARMERITAALPGAWIEHKPLAVALHVRLSDDAEGEAAIDTLRAEIETDEALKIHRGHKVLEVAVRPTSKTIAFDRLRSRLEPATTFFIGDDLSDEHVFSSLGSDDIAIKVGPGPSAATRRLDSPTEVVAFLAELARSLGAEPPTG